MNDSGALRDQMAAHHRDYTEWCMEQMAEFIKTGFSRDEAFELLIHYLDWVREHAAR